jgi:hypothetical protein
LAADRKQVEGVEAVEVGRRRVGEAALPAQQIGHERAARVLRRIGHRAADIGDDDGAAALGVDAEPRAARLEIAPRDNATAVVPRMERRGGACMKLVAIADEDDRPVGMDAVGKGDDAHARPYRVDRRPCQAS